MPETPRNVIVRAAEGESDVALVRALMLEYGTHLAANPAGAANICIAGYETELAGLPAPYISPGGLLLAEVDGITAGCVALKPLNPLAPSAEVVFPLEIKRLWVSEPFRGLGLGRELMTAAIDHARTAGAAAVYLDTVPAAMPEANRLYDALGFEPVERYNDNRVAGVTFFRLQLNAPNRDPS